MEINKDLVKELNPNAIIENQSFNNNKEYIANFGKEIELLSYKSNSQGYVGIDWKKYRFMLIIAGYGGYYYSTMVPISFFLGIKRRIAFNAHSYTGLVNGWVQYDSSNTAYANCAFGQDTETWFYGIW